MLNANFANLLYLVSGVLFILSLRGLSHPTTSRQGNRYGMIGMAIAMVTTLLLSPPSGFIGWLLLILGIGIGGGTGAYLARTVQMTSMPQLVAFFHSLVGLAAVLVAAGALYAPQAFGIGRVGNISKAQPVRNGAGCGHRCHHLHWLGDRLPETRWPDERQADHAAAAPRHQYRPWYCACCAHRPVYENREPHHFLADRRLCHSCSACC